jgi:D-xylose transport system permease protein
MSEVQPDVPASPAPETAPVAVSKPSWRTSLASAELDTRLFGMIAAVIVIWIAFNILSGGDFLTSRNLWNLSVQSTSIAIMATGMVLIIVSRNIDLSVGSLLGFLGYVMALVQTDGVIAFFNIKISLGSIGDSSWIWVIALVVGIGMGALVGAIQGFIIAYGGVPAFIVTLGGFLVWRGMIFRTGDKQGQTLSPLNDTFKLIGGGSDGSLGEWKSWLFGALGCAMIVLALWLSRRRRQRYELKLRPMWMDILFGAIGCGVVVAGIGLVANNYISPITGNPTGIAYPVVILIVATLAMSYLARRRRFGRYVYAYGGNPEAAELGGINTRRTVMLTFVLMGMLVGLSAAIQTARLNAAVTNLGVQNELDVIAAAVIGGTSFAGGIGTIAGAVLGAVIMQSLRSGMVLLNIDSPSQDIVVGVVLVTAVSIDSTLRLGRKRVAFASLAVGLLISAIVIQTGRG